jgi:hypothetical protein
VIAEADIKKSIDTLRAAMSNMSTNEARAVNLAVEVISGLRTEVIMYRNGMVRRTRNKDVYGEETVVPGEGG